MTIVAAKPFFSVVTVCFNAEATIERALSSLARQDSRDWESVVIDGASTDGTLQAVAQVAGLSPRVTSERDNGIYDAMNKGVRQSRGEVVYFLNADDQLHDPGVLQAVAAQFQTHPDTDLVFGNVVYVKPEGTVGRRFSHIRRRNLPFLDLNHQAVFARRRLFDTVGPFDLRFRINADYDWLIRVFRSGRRTQYLDRDIAYFDAGGRHVRDVEFLRKERREVRLQYMSPTVHDVGVFLARVSTKWRRMAGIDPRKHPG